MSQIISASRRTDLPALHPRWLVNRLRAGHALVRNPMNARQVERVSLAPIDVDALVLWTRHPRPLRPYLDEMVGRYGVPLWLVTVTGYPRLLERRTPVPARVVAELHDLAARFGAASLHWRYDPIVLSSLTPAAFHEDNFGHLAEQLAGAVEACHISFVDRHYRKTARRLAELERAGVALCDPSVDELRALSVQLATCGRGQGIEVLSCCEPALEPTPQGGAPPLEALRPAHPRASGCIELAWIQRATGRPAIHARPRPTRPNCLCCASKDIGAYDTCSLGCVYCYATRSDAAGRAGRRAVDAESEALGPATAGSVPPR